MKKGLLYVLIFIGGPLFGQVTKFEINEETFVLADIETLSFLSSHADTVEWNKNLSKIGFKYIPPTQQSKLLEYKKEVNGIYEYINFDTKYKVLTLIWKDRSGKNIITKSLKKTLKKKEYNSSGTYKIQHNSIDYMITFESNKEKAIYEMITVEIEKK